MSAPGCFHVSVYCSHLACVFPQHGAGPKHRRRILLEPWQQVIVDAAPWPFIRGCIRTDGCVFVNRTGPYEYLSYQFSNNSEDILGLFTHACDLAGVHGYRVNWHAGKGSVRINRRGDVELLLSHVGVKS